MPYRPAFPLCFVAVLSIVLLGSIPTLGSSQPLSLDELDPRLVEKIHPGLRNEVSLPLGDEATYVPIILMLEEQADLARLDADIASAGLDRKERAPVVIDELKSVATRSQTELAVALDGWRETGDVERVRAHWMVNAFSLSATPAAVFELAARDDVARIFLDGRLLLDEPVDGGAPPPIPGGTEVALWPGVAAVPWDLG